MTRVTEEPFHALAVRLGAASRGITKTHRDVVANATDDGREILRMELQATGAPPEVIDALRTMPDGEGGRAVGVPDNHPAANAAEDFEYGDGDHTHGPAGVFRMMSPQIAEWAADDVAGYIEQAMTG